MLIDVFAALPPRHVDARLTRLYKRFGLGKVFSVSDAATVLHLDVDSTFRLIFGNQNLEDSRFRACPHSGRIWLLAQDGFREAAKAWAAQYANVFAALPSSFGAQEFSTATGIPYSACNTLLSILLRYGYLHRAGGLDDSNSIYRLKPRRTVKVAA